MPEEFVPKAKSKTEIVGEVARLFEGRPDMTLHQLRLFWTIAHATTLTRAAKQLGMAQPSLSQQLAKLEKSVGTQLFHRRATEMALTEAGRFLLPRAEQVLRLVEDLSDGLGEYGDGQRVTLRIAGISSMLRVLMPRAMEQFRLKFPAVVFDIFEGAPADILEMLYARQITVGLVASNSVARTAVGFSEVPLLADPYVLVVPESLDLAAVHDPATDLLPEQRDLLRRSIQFSFGTQHSRRVEEWYSRMVPGHELVAQCRSFEIAISMVRAGVGVCLAPALSALVGDQRVDGVRLYAVDIPDRELVALIPSQYRRQRLYATLVEELRQAADQLPDLPALPTPPFMRLPIG
jgi:DNA-binding transcriptional LysR family regulator